MAAGLGVQLLTGTDWFPSVTVADEVQELVALGVPVAVGVAAGTYGARAWLRAPGFVEGQRADVVLFRDDPRSNATALFKPELIVVGGHTVTPVHGRVRS
jgi:imidazolonepropionase-like amidohydrolase